MTVPENNSEALVDMPPKPVQLTTKKIHQHKLLTSVLGLDISSNCKTYFAACFDGHIYEVDSESGKSTPLGTPHGSYATSVVLLEDRQTLISAGYDGMLQWHDLETKKTTRQIKAHDFWSWRAALSRDKKHFASVTGQYLAGGYKYEPAEEREPSVKIFHTETGELVRQFSHTPPVQSVAFSSDSQFIAAANLMGEVRIWEVESGKEVVRWTTPDFTSWGIIKSHCYIGGIFDMQFFPESDDLLLTGMGPMRDPMAGNGRQLWQRFDWRKTPPEKLDETHADESGTGLMETLAVSPDGDFFAMAGRVFKGDWNAAIFDQRTGRIIHSMNTGSRVTRAMIQEDDSRMLLAGTVSQGKSKDGKSKPFGRIDVYELTIS